MWPLACHTEGMKFEANAPLSTHVIDRTSETGLKGYALNGGRQVGEAVKRGGPLGGVIRNALPKPDRGANSPIPLPTAESLKKWQNTEDTYANEDFYDFGKSEVDHSSHTDALKEIFNPASLGTGKLTKMPRP